MEGTLEILIDRRASLPQVVPIVRFSPLVFIALFLIL